MFWRPRVVHFNGKYAVGRRNLTCLWWEYLDRKEYFWRSRNYADKWAVYDTAEEAKARLSVHRSHNKRVKEV